MRPPLFTSKEAYRLNTLIGQALSEPELCQRLLAHDESLIVEFSMPQHVWQIIASIRATSLKELCTNLLDLEMNG